MVTLKEARINKDISQVELARMAGTSQRLVSRAESGKTILKETLVKICAALDISPDDVTGVDALSRVGIAARRTKR